MRKVKGSLLLGAALVAAAMLAASAFASSVTTPAAPKKTGVHQIMGEVHPTLLRAQGESYPVYPPVKGVRIIDCKVERSSKWGFVMNMGGPIRNFKTCDEIHGKEFKGSGSFSVIPLDKPGNTGKIIVKFEDIL